MTDLPIEVGLAEAVPASGLITVRLSIETLIIETVSGNTILGCYIRK